MIKEFCKFEMFTAFNKLQALIQLKENGKGAYNFREAKSNLYWDLIQ